MLMMAGQKGKTMKRYYINGEEVTAQEAERQERENQKALASGDLAKMLDCKFITVIDTTLGDFTDPATAAWEMD